MKKAEKKAQNTAQKTENIFAQNQVKKSEEKEGLKTMTAKEKNLLIYKQKKAQREREEEEQRKELMYRKVKYFTEQSIAELQDILFWEQYAERSFAEYRARNNKNLLERIARKNQKEEQKEEQNTVTCTDMTVYVPAFPALVELRSTIYSLQSYKERAERKTREARERAVLKACIIAGQNNYTRYTAQEIQEHKKARQKNRKFALPVLQVVERTQNNGTEIYHEFSLTTKYIPKQEYNTMKEQGYFADIPESIGYLINHNSITCAIKACSTAEGKNGAIQLTRAVNELKYILAKSPVLLNNSYDEYLQELTGENQMQIVKEHTRKKDVLTGKYLKVIPYKTLVLSGFGKERAKNDATVQENKSFRLPDAQDFIQTASETYVQLYRAGQLNNYKDLQQNRITVMKACDSLISAKKAEYKRIKEQREKEEREKEAKEQSTFQKYENLEREIIKDAVVSILVKSSKHINTQKAQLIYDIGEKLAQGYSKTDIAKLYQIDEKQVRRYLSYTERFTDAQKKELRQLLAISL